MNVFPSSPLEKARERIYLIKSLNEMMYILLNEEKLYTTLGDFLKFLRSDDDRNVFKPRKSSVINVNDINSLIDKYDIYYTPKTFNMLENDEEYRILLHQNNFEGTEVKGILFIKVETKQTKPPEIVLNQNWFNKTVLSKEETKIITVREKDTGDKNIDLLGKIIQAIISNEKGVLYSNLYFTISNKIKYWYCYPHDDKEFKKWILDWVYFKFDIDANNEFLHQLIGCIADFAISIFKNKNTVILDADPNRKPEEIKALYHVIDDNNNQSNEYILEEIVPPYYEYKQRACIQGLMKRIDNKLVMELKENKKNYDASRKSTMTSFVQCLPLRKIITDITESEQELEKNKKIHETLHLFVLRIDKTYTEKLIKILNHVIEGLDRGKYDGDEAVNLNLLTTEKKNEIINKVLRRHENIIGAKSVDDLNYDKLFYLYYLLILRYLYDYFGFVHIRDQNMPKYNWFVPEEGAVYLNDHYYFDQHTMDRNNVIYSNLCLFPALVENEHLIVKGIAY